MKLFSTRNSNTKANLEKAVLQGLAEDGGLFIPEEIPRLSPEFFQNISAMSLQEIAFTVSNALIGSEIPAEDLKKIINESITFDAPLVKLSEDSYFLELFHGPTLAFKDFGARFMARAASYFLAKRNEEITVLVATSGDTGSAVGQGFLGTPNTKVIILYPSGKVSPIQELQLTTIGENVTALEVNGNFDDCQRMVKEAFLSPNLKVLNLTSANSINIARLIPQTFYYFYAYAQLGKPAIFSVPSGNLGNLTAGLISKKMGLPVKKFIASHNINNAFTEFLESGSYEPRPSKKTISNAMDVGSPSNIERILALYNNRLAELREDVVSFSFNDEATAQAITEIYQKYDYIADPHGAVGYLGLKAYQQDTPDQTGIILETAHPAKFPDTVTKQIKQKPEHPILKSYLQKEKKSVKLTNTFTELESYLLNSKI